MAVPTLTLNARDLLYRAKPYSTVQPTPHSNTDYCTSTMNAPVEIISGIAQYLVATLDYHTSTLKASLEIMSRSTRSMLAPYAIRQSRSISPRRNPPSLK